MIQKLLKYISALNYKTFYFNFKYLPFKDAIKLPFFINKRVALSSVKGRIILNTPISIGIVKIGFGGVGIFDKKYSRSIWNVEGQVTFNGRADIGHGSKISVGAEGQLSLGSNLIISAESSIAVNRKVSIGNDCVLSWEILIMDSDWHYIENQEGLHINPDQDITIGDRVWIGCRCSIFKGVKIGDDIIIAATTTVTKSATESYNIYGDHPLRILKSNISWKH